MYNLLRYFIKYGAFILFIFFEILAFYWVINYNQNQRRIFAYSAEEVTGRFYERMGKITEFLELRSVSDSLASRNAYLESQISQLRYQYDYTAVQSSDSLNAFTYIPAAVVSNSINNRNNTILINRGKADGVEPGMGVVSDDGPVGIVTKSTRNFSVIMSILNSQALVSASIKPSNHFGTLMWDQSNPKEMSLTAIPKYVQINIGDTVVTSGYSLVYPPDRPVGRVKSYSIPDGSNFYDIKIDLSYDMANISYVYVTKRANNQQLDSLYAQ